jgi:2-polyprenyl-3-methyl-5-hydroxy-6-metoxy-1,4-benzoquinol methylase
MAIDQSRLDEFLGRGVSDMGAALGGLLVVVGDKLGLYKAMAGAGPMTAAALAKKTGTGERQVREWLNAQASCGYVTYDPASQAYTLPDEQAFCLANEESPAFLPGFFQIALASWKVESRITEAFRSGKGMGWHEHDPDLFSGTFRFFRPGYNANLVSSWIPSLEGVEAKLKAGARVADVGCGLGSSTVIMAKAYPKSRFVGFDYHASSIESARKHAADNGVADRVTFEVARAQDYPGRDYDLVAFFDCLHDMGDPIGAARHVRETLKPDGTWLLVEPFANDRLEDNLNAVGRIFYSASAVICTPASLSQDGAMALGAQAGEARLREIATAAGFRRFRRATETAFNLILEGRP